MSACYRSINEMNGMPDENKKAHFGDSGFRQHAPHVVVPDVIRGMTSGMLPFGASKGSASPARGGPEANSYYQIFQMML